MGFFPSFSLETWVLIIIFLGVSMLYGIWPYNVFKKTGIPGPQPLPFIGTFHGYRNGVMQYDQKCYQKYGKLWRLFDGRQPMVAILDPVMIKTILVKEFYTYFTNRRDIGLNGELDTSIVVAMDQHWKRIRSILSPAFTSGKLKEPSLLQTKHPQLPKSLLIRHGLQAFHHFGRPPLNAFQLLNMLLELKGPELDTVFQILPIINHYGEMLVKNVEKKMDSEESLDVREIFGAYSLDVVTSTSFSINVDSMNNPNDPFITHIKKFLKFDFFNPLILLIVLFPFFTPLLEKLGVTLAPTATVNFYLDAVKKIKKERQETGHKTRFDFLKLMMDSQVSNHTSEEGRAYKGLTDKEIIAQAIFFIFGGYATTSITLSFLSYFLATHPDVQQRLQEEIDEAFPGQAPPTYDAVVRMEYLDMVVNETLRLYPPLGRLERVSKKTVKINEVIIPGGAVIMIPIYVLHRDPEYWPEPEEFRPERFSKENKEFRDPYIFMPFGVGPRNCIGMRFALLALKVAVVVLLQRFSFRTCKETPIPMEIGIGPFMEPKRPIKLKMVPRACPEPEE